MPHILSQPQRFLTQNMSFPSRQLRCLYTLPDAHLSIQQVILDIRTQEALFVVQPSTLIFACIEVFWMITVNALLTSGGSAEGEFSLCPFFEYRGKAHKHFTAIGLLASITQPYVEGLHSKETSSSLYCCGIVASIKAGDRHCRLATSCSQLGAGRGLAGTQSALLQMERQGEELTCNCRRLKMPIKCFVQVCCVHLLLV